MWPLQTRRILLAVIAAVSLGATSLLASGCEDEQIRADEEPVETRVGGQAVQVEQALRQPKVYEGRTVVGQATIAEVISDRAFAIRKQGKNMVVILRERDPSVRLTKAAAGRQVRLRGVLLNTNNRGRIRDKLDADTQYVLDKQEYYLLTNARNVEVEVSPQARL